MANIAESNVATCIVLPRVLRAEVQEYALKHGISMAEVIRQAITECLDKHRTASLVEEQTEPGEH
ncbi:hypothetical protein R54767_04697 [Paraburkholderia gardini]|uniref:Ribbon-helix-helix CopG family protein n=1 Tax=Paraburkholderia gardini TaxID=2823469 RepID=A0ABM8U9R5_9BURK|nr:hypothetical protein R54767_04697 [Paraburkholderia gardini]